MPKNSAKRDLSKKLSKKSTNSYMRTGSITKATALDTKEALT